MDDDIEVIGNVLAIEVLEQMELDANFVRGLTYNENVLDPFEHLSDGQFIGMYRLSKELVKQLIEMVRPFMKAPSRHGALSIERKVLTALRFFAAGSYQMDVGENQHSAVSQPTVSRIIEEVVNALCEQSIIDQYIQFPKNFEELNAKRQEFYNKYGFPGIIGVIDCTHIAIVPPHIEDDIYPEHVYVNRKGYHSINTQLICDANLQILNVSAKFPGSANDTHVWNESDVKTLVTDLHNRGHTSYFLLGDSGYALRPWLMTPFVDPEPNSPEAAFNNSFCKIRSTIERCIGVLKMRFRCLLKHRVLHYAPNKASKIINACIVLHNMCIKYNIPLNEDILNNDNDLENFEIPEVHLVEDGNIRNRNPELVAGRLARQHIVNSLFT